MELNKYQEQAMTTCMESSNNFAYMFYNLLGEVGELIEKVNIEAQDEELAQTIYDLRSYSIAAKLIRKRPDCKDAQIYAEINQFADRLKDNTDLQKEAGDILWQLAGLCSVMGWSLEDIAQQNLDKLASRQERGKIDGDGDNR